MTAREPTLHAKKCSRPGAWAVALLVLIFPGGYRSQSGSPDLKPFQPEGWSDAIVVSNRTGTHVDTLLSPTDRLYLDFAVINSGNAPVTRPFRIDLYLDGQLWESFDAPPPLEPQVYRFLDDYPIRSLSTGAHTLRIVADAGEAIAESDESNNDYTRTVIVGGACVPLTLRVSPRGAGRLDPSQSPTCGGSTVSISSVSGSADRPGRAPVRLGLAGEPLRKARRARAFAALKAKVGTGGRVSVIVGLRTPGRAAATAAGGLDETAARASRISRVQQAFLIRMDRHNLATVRPFKFVPYVAMQVDGAALETLASDPEVVSIEEDIAVKPALGESTPLVGAPHAWSRGYAGAGQTVAILDTGVDKDHPFLAGKVVSEACYSGWDGDSVCPGGGTESTEPGSGGPCSQSGCFHGTAMAGVAAGRGPEFSGLAPEAGIIAIQVFSQCGPGCLAASTSDWMAGLERVLELADDFDVAAVNMSFGRPAAGSGNCDAEFPAVKATLDRLLEAGIAPVVASGNDGSETGLGFPACISGAVSVGATGLQSDGAEVVTSFSNSAPSLDLLAPGWRITTSVPGGGFSEETGTSLAVPHVSGALAVLKSKAPRASAEQLLTVLKHTGIPIDDFRNGVVTPRIQVDAALSRVIPQVSYSSGTRLTLTARPYPGYRFEGWQGCEAPAGNRCVVEMDGSRSLVALFEPLTANPDLILTSLTGSSTVAVGRRAAVAAGIHNPGANDAGPFRLGFYLSADPVVTTDDLWFAACTYDAGLPAGASRTCRQSFPLPPRVSPGTYYLGAIVDDLDQVAENSEANNARTADSGPMEVLPPRIISRSFVPVVLNAAGLNDSFFTSEMTLTNRGTRTTAIDYTYKAHLGGGSGEGYDRLAPGQQKIVPEVLAYLRGLGIPVPRSGSRLGTLGMEISGAPPFGILVRTTTAVPEGRAGLAYPGIDGDEGFQEAVYLCGLRQNRQDRSNLALQNMGTLKAGPITLRTTVFSGDAGDTVPRVLEDVTLEPGGFHQYSGVLGALGGSDGSRNGYVKVERVEGTAPFYAYGVINDQANSDGSFVFPVTAASLEGATGQTLPVIVKTGPFTSELTVTNFSEAPKTVNFSFVAGGVRTGDQAARFSLALAAGEQRIIPDIVDEMRQQGVAGIGPGRGLAGAVFATVARGDMSGIVMGARTGSPGGGGQYSVFYTAVPDGAAFIDSAWIDGLRQDAENRSNLALVNTGEVDGGDSVFSLDIYDGDTGNRVKTVGNIIVSARRWRQLNSILADHAPGTRQGYIQVRKVAGNNPFLAYGVVNDGGAPGHRSGDGAYIPARE